MIGLLDALKISTAHYCGLSVGGLIGQWLGIHAPQRFKSLTLCNTAAHIGTTRRLEHAHRRTCAKAACTPIANGVISRWFTEGFAKRAPETVELTRQMLLHSPPDGYVATCAAIRDEDLREQVSRLTLPTLVISGAKDAATHGSRWPIHRGENPAREICRIERGTPFEY